MHSLTLVHGMVTFSVRQGPGQLAPYMCVPRLRSRVEFGSEFSQGGTSSPVLAG